MAARPPFHAVYFDCDSTLSAIEGIDELVRPLPAAVQQELRALTERAMNGEMPLAEVYERRLATIAPSRAQVEAIAAMYIEREVIDAKAVVDALQFLGKTVGIVSGGLLPPVLALAHHLGIRGPHVVAVPIHFRPDGRYDGFDRACPLWKNGGKIDVLRALPTAHRPLAFVGDGATDLETQGTAAD
ncbi:MAG: HAD-IB family phosphatase, partial [Planctomycetota bacterium]